MLPRDVFRLTLLRAGILRPLAAVLLGCVFAVATRAADAVRRFDLGAGDAIETLKRAAQQAGSQIMFPAQAVQGVRTNAVRGEYTVRDALDLMVQGTPLVVLQDQTTGALTVTRRAPPVAPPAAHPPPSPPPAPKNANADSVIQLPNFSVSTGQDDSYVGKEALSTTRTGIALLDLAQSVKVINREFLEDLNPGLIVDTLKYVGGGQAGNINFADDRFTMRGFNSAANGGDFVDGFRGTTDSNTDPAIIERLEIIKGPSAIFVANGPVGGVINKIIKGPVSYDLRTLKVQAGLFDGNRAELDLGGPVTADRKLLYRFVLAGQDSAGWYDHTYTKRLIVAPSLSYDFGENSRLTFKYNYFIYRFSSYNGLPWDERTGRIIAIDRRSTLSEDDPLNWRKDIVHRGILEYTNRLTDHLAMRLAGFYSYNDAARVESVNGLSLSPSFVDGTLLARSTTAQDQVHNRRQVQADFVATLGTGAVNHRFLVGGEWADAPDVVASFPAVSSPVDPFHLQFPGTVTLGAVPNSQVRTNNRQWKGFALETAGFFHDTLLLSAGMSRVDARTSSANQLAQTSTAPLSVAQNLRQFGLVWKLTPEISLFGGYNENFAPNFLNGLVLPSQTGKQAEAGIKAEAFDGRLLANLSYFDLKQENAPVPSFPQTTPPTFVLVPGETSRGIDGDITYRATPGLDVVFSFADFAARARSQANTASPLLIQPVNNVAQQTLGLWTRYKFTGGGLKGFAAAAGLSYLSKRAVASNNNAMVYGYVPGFCVLDLNLTCDRGPFRYAVGVNNLFGRDYIAAVRNQSVVIPGMGTNLKASVTWKF